ncbi:MAG: DUF2188 domain-containing protein [Thermodesulfobacteriota bacterium]
MAKKRDVYHVVPTKDGWGVKKEGNQRNTANTDTKKEAIDTARGLAKQGSLGQVKVHKQDGTIQNEWTYGQDPRDIRG